MCTRNWFTRASHLAIVQGNCSEPAEPAALDLADEEVPTLIPLKPRQCLLLFDAPLLMINSGRVWVDNLYLKLTRSRAHPGVAFIAAGAARNKFRWPLIARSDTYVTGVTFHSHQRRSAVAFDSSVDNASAMFSGACCRGRP